MKIAEFAEQFQRRFRVRPRIFCAPGRVNLIGEHTDYNDGFVLPSAIGFRTHVAVSPRSDNKFVLRSIDFPQEFEFDSLHLPQHRLGAWCDYVVGVVWQLRRLGVELGGVNLLVNSEIPIGAGLSSSAALEVSTALAVLSVAEKELPLETVARLCQRAEVEFVGARVGIMDQFVSCLGKQRHALLLDCRSLEFQHVAIPDTVKLAICNTMVKHQLSGGGYNVRRQECEEGVRLLASTHPKVRALRDVTAEQLARQQEGLPSVIYNRCLHVIEENRRVLESVNNLRAGDLRSVGRLMRESHGSLRDLYEVSCHELDTMVAAAEGLPGYYGGRMTGGGFGGCTVNLVESSHAESFAAKIATRYRENTGVRPEVYICAPENGAAAEMEIV